MVLLGARPKLLYQPFVVTQPSTSADLSTQPFHTLSEDLQGTSYKQESTPVPPCELLYG